ncbi:hypothetical protein [Edaphobacter modestus]|uniref:Uncharacterized protein n=1 Tax=Edaphobacter modestus TaxID=388466 RepID=A0A4Q7YRZ5_9BACT|nr:hypothetical protein [Edaphobacter modestus]RZU39721.1 hypothetical protein BDD14_1114 [Edaphobacter modestus]
MQFIMRILCFFAALFRHWWQWMSCAIGTLLTFYIAETNQPNAWIAHAIVVLAVLFLLVATYGAWSDERSKVEDIKNKCRTLEASFDERKPKFEIRIGQV